MRKLLAFLYRIIVNTNNLIHEKFRKPYRPIMPVISVGGIEMGGSGKTPFTIYLAKFLLDYKISPIILSRGYKRVEKERIILREKDTYSFEETGDEPMMINQQTGCPVIIHKDRAYSSKLIPRVFDKLSNPIILLDDGFQHRHLFRDIDIVIITGEEKISNRHFFPLKSKTQNYAKCLRDNPSRLSQADLILIKGAKVDDIHDYTDAEVFYFNYELISKPRSRCCVVSAIADNNSFKKILEAHNYDILDFHFFRDHHIFTKADIDKIVISAEEKNCECIITTSKDLIRMKYLQFGMPVYPAEIEIRFDNEETLIQKLKDIIINKTGLKL